MRRRRLLSLLGVWALLAALLGPFAGATTRAATGREPVIVIPGVAGSEFTAASAFRLSVDNGHGGTYTRDYGAGEQVWVNEWQAAALGDDDYFDALKLKADGTTPEAPALRVGGLYGSAYDDLVDFLQDQGYTLGVDLWLFPYDWRRDIRATTAQLDALVTRALVAANGGRADPATWTIRRADLVGHSMGGMVGRNYIADPARAGRIDQLITLGSPQLGATKFLKALVYGDQFGPSFLGLGLNPQEVRDVVQNMPGGMQLLPSAPYYTYYDNSDSSRLRPWVEDRDIDRDGVARGALSSAQVSRTLLNLGKNGAVLDLAAGYHAGIDGGRQGGVNGVRWAALIGYGHGTLGQLREYTGSCLTWSGYKPCPKRDEIPVDGDGTVAIMSAAMGDPWRGTLIASGAQLWYVEREHGALVQRDSTLGIETGDGPALSWLGEQLRGATAVKTPGVSLAGAFPLAAPAFRAAAPPAAAVPGVTPAPTERLRGAWISALGPVALQVRDASGRTVGRERGAETTPRPTLPDARHERLPDGEFAFVKRDAPYTFTLAAEEEGSVDLKVRVLGNGRVERTAVYLAVPLGATGSARLALRPGTGRAAAPQGWPDLEIDADGDGTFETAVRASAVLDTTESADTAAPDLAVTSPAAGGNVAGAVTIRWQAADPGAGLLLDRATIVATAGGAAPRAVGNGEAVALPAGEYRLQVVALDRAGNAAGREVVFTVR